MFTGIIESIGKVIGIQKDGSNRCFRISSPVSRELKIDQSVSHNGVCLTVVGAGNDYHDVIAVNETLNKSNLGSLETDDLINLERCMLANGRFDGHIVQGHVDQTGKVTSIDEADGSWLFEISYDPQPGNITVEKGSICVNGVSLTCFNSQADRFTVAIIPYTFEHTNFKALKVGDVVNLEFDIIGKYIQRILTTPVVTGTPKI